MATSKKKKRAHGLDMPPEPDRDWLLTQVPVPTMDDPYANPTVQGLMAIREKIRQEMAAASTPPAPMPTAPPMPVNLPPVPVEVANADARRQEAARNLARGYVGPSLGPFPDYTPPPPDPNWILAEALRHAPEGAPGYRTSPGDEGGDYQRWIADQIAERQDIAAGRPVRKPTGPWRGLQSGGPDGKPSGASGKERPPSTTELLQEDSPEVAARLRDKRQGQLAAQAAMAPATRAEAYARRNQQPMDPAIQRILAAGMYSPEYLSAIVEAGVARSQAEANNNPEARKWGAVGAYATSPGATPEGVVSVMNQLGLMGGPGAGGMAPTGASLMQLITDPKDKIAFRKAIDDGDIQTAQKIARWYGFSDDELANARGPTSRRSPTFYQPPTARIPTGPISSAAPPFMPYTPTW